MVESFDEKCKSNKLWELLILLENMELMLTGLNFVKVLLFVQSRIVNWKQYQWVPLNLPFIDTTAKF